MEKNIDSNRFIDINIDSDTESPCADRDKNNNYEAKSSKNFFNFKKKPQPHSKVTTVDPKILTRESEDDDETVEEVESEDEFDKTAPSIKTSSIDRSNSKSMMNSSTLSVCQSPKLSLDESEIVENFPISWEDFDQDIDQDELLQEIEQTLNESRKTTVFRSSSACLPKTPKTKLQQKSLSNKTSINSSIRNESLVEGLLGDIYDRFNITLKDNMDSDVFTEMSLSSSRFSGIDSNADHESECRKSFKVPKSALQNFGILFF